MKEISDSLDGIAFAIFVTGAALAPGVIGTMVLSGFALITFIGFCTKDNT